MSFFYDSANDSTINDNFFSTTRDLDMTKMAKMANEKIDWIFEDFIVKDDQVMIAGAAKSGKSWLALQLALAAAGGAQFLRWNATRKFKTLYINLEVGEHMWAKRVMVQAGASFNQFKDNFYSLCGLRSFNVSNTSDFLQIQQHLKQNKYEFVVIDVLSRTHVADENLNGEMQRVLLELRKMCDCTHVIVHHSRKPPSGSEHVNLGASSVRGASSIVGEVDLALVLVKLGSTGAKYSVQISARNIEEPDELLLDRGANMLYFEHQGNENTVEDIIKTLFADAQEVDRNDVHAAVSKGLGCAKETARKKVKSLVLAGVLKEGRENKRYFYYLQNVNENNAYFKQSKGS